MVNLPSNIRAHDLVKNSSEFLRHPDALDQVLALIKRTDDPNIAYEATRIFISVIKSLSKTKNESSVDPARLCQRDVITCLVDLLRRTWKWPILINDSMISLTLLTISGPEGTGKSRQHLSVGWKLNDSCHRHGGAGTRASGKGGRGGIRGEGDPEDHLVGRA
jgi:hypothetical protein